MIHIDNPGSSMLRLKKKPITWVQKNNAKIIKDTILSEAMKRKIAAEKRENRIKFWAQVNEEIQNRIEERKCLH